MKITVKGQREKKERKKIIFKREKELGKGPFIYDSRNIHIHPILV